MKPRLKKTVQLKNGGYSADFMETVNIARSTNPKCYNIYLVDVITVPAGETGMLGQTGHGKDANGKDRTGTIVETSGCSDFKIADTLAHELGHGMGLRQGSGQDADGVTGHSTKPNNLMALIGNGRHELNAKQCAAARKRGLLMDTKGRCNEAPDE